jgi:hypothetical protein
MRRRPSDGPAARARETLTGHGPRLWHEQAQRRPFVESPLKVGFFLKKIAPLETFFTKG